MSWIFHHLPLLSPDWSSDDQINLGSLDGTDGYMIDIDSSRFSLKGNDWESWDYLPSVSGGDINGDGLSDILIASPVDNKVYVVFGSKGWLYLFICCLI